MPAVETYDHEKGCPVCGEIPTIKPVCLRPGKAAAYPALLYHYEQRHKTLKPPPPKQDRVHIAGKPEGDPVGDDMPDAAWLTDIRLEAALELKPKTPTLN